jgi:DNA (cytosine-5)-methyltransferase 1
LGLRRLHPRECAAIQTFPSAWTFAGNRSAQYRQIGNAVPPLLAYAIATCLKTHIEAAEQAKELRPRELVPLGDHLMSAIRYTINDERKNGHSRRAAPVKRRARISVAQES